MITLHKHRFAFVLMSLSTVFIALAPLFLVASCTSLQQTPQEIQAEQDPVVRRFVTGHGDGQEVALGEAAFN